MKKDKGRHCIMMKGSIQDEDITLLNIYTLNIGAPRYMEQILRDIKGETDKNTIIVGEFNIPLTSMDGSPKQKIKKATEVLNNTINHLDLIDRYRILHPKSPEYKLFSSTQGTFSRTDQILGHQTYLNKFKRTEIISSIFFDHNGMKLEINHKQKNGKRTNIWRLNNMLLKHQWVNNKIKEEIRKYLKTN